MIPGGGTVKVAKSALDGRLDFKCGKNRTVGARNGGLGSFMGLLWCRK